VNDIEHIEKYLGGELSRDELQAFDLRLQNDKTFAEIFALYKSVEAEMHEAEDETELRNRLSGISQKHFNIAAPAKIIKLKTNRTRWLLYATAAAASIIILLFLKPWQDKVFTNEELYAQYAVPEELPTVVRGTNDDSLLINATKLFNEIKYPAALIQLDSIVKQRPTEAQLQLALGICYLKTGNFDSAINRFDSLAVQESVYKYVAMEWKAFVYLKQNKTAECIAVLKMIPADAGNYKRANELIGKLSKK
jgi:tetratricopeptide (TPR) repeat protein